MMNYINKLKDRVQGIKDDVDHVLWNKENPKPGDMIQFQMPGFQHWGIYVGDGNVVHFTLPAVSFIPLKFKVRKEQVKDVKAVLTSAVYNKYDKQHSPLPQDRVVKRAEHMVGKAMKYDLGKANCEHFATMMRYNIPISGQAERFNLNVNRDFEKEMKEYLAEIDDINNNKDCTNKINPIQELLRIRGAAMCSSSRPSPWKSILKNQAYRFHNSGCSAHLCF